MGGLLTALFYCVNLSLDSQKRKMIKEMNEQGKNKKVETAPKYHIGDIVIFSYPHKQFELKGKIVMVDTYPNSTTIEYDIMLLDESHLYKHLDESYIKGIDSAPR